MAHDTCVREEGHVFADTHTHIHSSSNRCNEGRRAPVRAFPSAPNQSRGRRWARPRPHMREGSFPHCFDGRKGADGSRVPRTSTASKTARSPERDDPRRRSTPVMRRRPRPANLGKAHGLGRASPPGPTPLPRRSAFLRATIPQATNKRKAGRKHVGHALIKQHIPCQLLICSRWCNARAAGAPSSHTISKCNASGGQGRTRFYNRTPNNGHAPTTVHTVLCLHMAGL